MTDEILKAALDEALAFLQSKNDGDFPGTLILETNYKSEDLLSYSLPLLILDLMDAPEESQYPGGTTRTDWVWGFNAYAMAGDSFVDDVTPYATSPLKIIDAIRRHFSLRFWLVPPRTNDTMPMSMQDITDNYGFKYTLSGRVRAKPLDQDGLYMGWRIMFDSVCIDEETNWTLDNQGPLEHVTQSQPDNS